MRHLVAIETSTDLGSIAVGAGDELLGEMLIGMRSRHAESLLPALDFLLRTSRLERRDITGVVVGSGPGSFTGVRVAAATGRGLCHGLGVPLFAWSSLAVLAAASTVDGPVCALFDARRGEVYAACYDVRGGTIRSTLMEPMAGPVADVRARLGSLSPYFVGEGAVRYAEELGLEAPAPVPPRASALLRLATSGAAGGGPVSHASAWEPGYVRESGAERGIAG
ncbi:MAG TPA: tRNA (adenosine(37)-N6)-threonylcarbamoyltransferase complex dimerization subunit type 1 TsaB [Longimicrobiales bacterium]|nr:tRNA (adenosine(37)-N6)-threonylcarbamoyltransferase complex dimerization subunit type 1 TsaB [Longimicrobiales bacterium]